MRATPRTLPYPRIILVILTTRRVPRGAKDRGQQTEIDGCIFVGRTRVSRSLDGFDFRPSTQSQQRTNPPTESFKNDQQHEILGLERAPRHLTLCSRRPASGHSPFRSPAGCPWTQEGCCCCRTGCCSVGGMCRVFRWAMEFPFLAANTRQKQLFD